MSLESRKTVILRFLLKLIVTTPHAGFIFLVQTYLSLLIDSFVIDPGQRSTLNSEPRYAYHGLISDNTSQRISLTFAWCTKPCPNDYSQCSGQFKFSILTFFLFPNCLLFIYDWFLQHRVLCKQIPAKNYNMLVNSTTTPHPFRC